MVDSLEVMKANFGEPESRIRFGERRCIKSNFDLPSEIQRYGRALDNVDKIMSMEWFLTAKDENGKRFLVCGKADHRFRLSVVNIDVEDNVHVLSSPLFERFIKPGCGFEVKVEGMDRITEKDRARGGFWCVFSPINVM
jgi:hypothetical protein